eukprot:3893410-Rhodomonas_salina.2
MIDVCSRIDRGAVKERDEAEQHNDAPRRRPQWVTRTGGHDQQTGSRRYLCPTPIYRTSTLYRYSNLHFMGIEKKLGSKADSSGLDSETCARHRHARLAGGALQGCVRFRRHSDTVTVTALTGSTRSSSESSSSSSSPARAA